MRKTPFVTGEYYHVFNRGTDKREIFLENADIERFFQSMTEFNTPDPIGSIYEKSFRKPPLGGLTSKSSALVGFVSYCLNPNHFHLLLRQKSEKGIEKLMQRLGTGYSMFFNNKYKRNGALFQGTFKSIHVDSNEYLLHLSSYINLNPKVHRLPLGGLTSKSSWEEYSEGLEGICGKEKEVILGQFKKPEDYKKFAEDGLETMLMRKDMEKFLLE